MEVKDKIIKCTLWILFNVRNVVVFHQIVLVQIGYGLFCGSLWVWRRKTNCRPSCPPTMSNTSTSAWIAQPDGSGWWDNQMATQHLPRDLVQPSSGYKNWLKRRFILCMKIWLKA